jgi:transposase
MKTEEKQRTLFVGIDVHKDTHTAVGVSPFGEKLFETTIGNYQKDFDELSKRIREVGDGAVLSPFVGLEDCSGYGERIARALYAEGFSVVHVPPILVDRLRKRQTHPEKSDSLDALGVAKVMMHDTDSLPVYSISEQEPSAKFLRELSQDREYSVVERSRLRNQLHLLLHRIYNTEYQTYFKDPFALKALRHWVRVSPPQCDPYLLRSLKRKARRMLELHVTIKELEKDMQDVMNTAGYTLVTASGCGVVLAATMIGEIGDIHRFKSPASLAKYAGCAPREHSSGKTVRYRKTRSGNRRLNCAFHRMALSQISPTGNDAARTYFKKKVSEGKTKAQALVCLRRHMVTVCYMMLKHSTEYRCPQ